MQNKFHLIRELQSIRLKITRCIFYLLLAKDLTTKMLAKNQDERLNAI